MDFHCEDPKDLDIDQIIDFLYDLKEVQERNWRTIKIYVAGLRWYYQHMLGDVEIATSIPYPKEGKTLPKIISREELADLFNACSNPKHRVMCAPCMSSSALAVSY
jgi:integrase